ncbi:MAG: sialate O-acetylesterase, partial [Myxococcota bacterium]|nr:sialate O-acetylesterase [Myxococcota bacterium]
MRWWSLGLTLSLGCNADGVLSMGKATDPGDTASQDSGPGTDTSDTDAAETIEVYLLAGQSNMEGLGQVVALPQTQRVAQDDVWIYWSGVPVWRGLEPSSGYSSGWGAYFGPEVTFGRAMADALADQQVALIKHSVGGTDLEVYWDPGESSDDPDQGEGYATFAQTVAD